MHTYIHRYIQRNSAYTEDLEHRIGICIHTYYYIVTVHTIHILYIYCTYTVHTYIHTYIHTNKHS